jgi:hypothetical protein
MLNALLTRIEMKAKGKQDGRKDCDEGEKGTLVNEPRQIEKHLQWCPLSPRTALRPVAAPLQLPSAALSAHLRPATVNQLFKICASRVPHA